MNMENEHGVDWIAENRERGPHGVGGWLALLVFSLMVLWPVASLSALANMFATLEGNGSAVVSFEHYEFYKTHYWALVWGCAALSFSAGCALWRIHRRSSVSWTIWVLWSMFAARLVCGVSLEMWFFNTSPDAFFSVEIANSFFETLVVESIPSAIVGVMAIGAWTAYLLRSRRVANTYREGAESGRAENEAAENRLRDLHEAAENRLRNLHGVGGWLAFLIFLLMVLWPVVSLSTSVYSLPLTDESLSTVIDFEQLGIFKPIYWALIWGCAAGSFSAGYVLLQIHRQSSVRWAIRVLYGLPFVKVTADVVAELWFLSPFIDEFFGKSADLRLVGVFARAAVYLAACVLFNKIWTAYLLCSRRVENTYAEPVQKVAIA